MTIEERISDDLRRLSGEFHSMSWQSAKDEAPSAKDEPKPGSPTKTGKKSEPDLKNKASRLLDLMISLGEIERRGRGRKSS